MLGVDGYEAAAVIDNPHRGPYRAATFEPAFDSRNQMVVGFNMYVGGRFVGVYDDPLGPSTEPTAYLNDLASMPVAATFDEHDNLYVVDHNRGRVLVYWNPLDNPPQDPEYPAVIRAVVPPSPYCVLRTADQERQRTATLIIDGLSDSDDLALQVRNLAFSVSNYYARNDVLTLAIGTSELRKEGNRISIAGDWSRLWPEHDKARVIARVLLDGKPLTSWSPPFTIADDASACDGPTYDPPRASPTALPTG